MHRSGLGSGLILTCVVALASSRCGSSSSNTDGGPPGGGSKCTSSGPSEGVACTVALTGAITSSFNCTSAFAVHDSTTNITSLVQIGAQNQPSVKSLDITLAVIGTPGAGSPGLVVGNSGYKPNNIIIFLNDNLNTPYQTFFTGAGEMSLTITAADENKTDGGADLWCVHGNLKADVPGLYNPSSVIHLDAGF